MASKFQKQQKTQNEVLSFANIPAFLLTKTYLERNQELQKEINAKAEDSFADRNTFKRTPEQKIAEKEAKEFWKREMRNEFGENWRKSGKINPSGVLF